jgi:hypothetical protein
MTGQGGASTVTSGAHRVRSQHLTHINHRTVPPGLNGRVCRRSTAVAGDPDALADLFSEDGVYEGDVR